MESLPWVQTPGRIANREQACTQPAPKVGNTPLYCVFIDAHFFASFKSNDTIELEVIFTFSLNNSRINKYLGL